MPEGPKLRVPAVRPPFRIVLVEPEIPGNTGAIARTCAATGSPLHLVGELGFSLDEHGVRRAGLDYWHLVSVHRHGSLAELRRAHPEGQMHLFSATAGRSYLEATMEPGDALVFGRESVGLPGEILERHPDHVWAIPTSGPVRSLNLSNAMAIVLYEALRACGGLGQTFLG